MNTHFSTLPLADGVWHRLRPVPGALTADTLAAPGAEISVVVAQGQISWIGPHGDVPAAHAALPTFDGGGAWLTPG